MALYFYNGIIGKYCLQETNGTLTRMWVGNRLSLVPENDNIQETDLLREAKAQLDAYFDHRLKEFSLPLTPQGTDFQLSIWKLLQQIPYGKTLTYGEIAALSGNPHASRAVGMANGKNPLPVFIPCHRVIGSSGKLTGYTGGLDIKQTLLKLESL